MAAGLIKRIGDGLRLLGKGELTAKVTIEAVAATKGAISGVENAGGVLNLLNAGAAPSGPANLESSPAV